MPWWSFSGLVSVVFAREYQSEGKYFAAHGSTFCHQTLLTFDLLCLSTERINLELQRAFGWLLAPSIGGSVQFVFRGDFASSKRNTSSRSIKCTKPQQCFIAGIYTSTTKQVRAKTGGLLLLGGYFRVKFWSICVQISVFGHVFCGAQVDVCFQTSLTIVLFALPTEQNNLEPQTLLSWLFLMTKNDTVATPSMITVKQGCYRRN